MTELILIRNNDGFSKTISRESFVDFIYHHMGEFGDKNQDIEKAITYAFSDAQGKGGFCLLALQDEEMVGGAVVIDTGMSGYIPPHILVYIVTHKQRRGEGIGTQILKKIINECSGDIALHVEYDNPAVHLYEKMGFTSKYKEMRYAQKEA